MMSMSACANDRQSVERRQAFKEYVVLSSKQRQMDKACNAERAGLKKSVCQIVDLLKRSRDPTGVRVPAVARNEDGKNKPTGCILCAYRMPNNRGYVTFKRLPARAKFHTVSDVEKCITRVTEVHLRTTSGETAIDRIIEAILRVSRSQDPEKLRLTRSEKPPRSKSVTVHDPSSNEAVLLDRFVAMDDRLEQLRKERKRLASEIETRLTDLEPAAKRYIVDGCAPEADPAKTAPHRTVRIQDPSAPGAKTLRYRVHVQPGHDPREQVEPDKSEKAKRLRLDEMRTVLTVVLTEMIPSNLRARNDDIRLVAWLSSNAQRLVDRLKLAVAAFEPTGRGKASPPTRKRKRGLGLRLLAPARHASPARETRKE